MAVKTDIEHAPGWRKWLPMIILSLALMIIVIDTTILNVSLKLIVNDLHTNLQGVQWVITAYALTLGALTITGGRLGDLFGRKRMFVVGAVIFAIGSFITSISRNVGVMITGESLIEGVGAALMMPATASLLITTYKGRDRALAFGIWGGIAAASTAIGPIVGGFLTSRYSWRWAFRINIFVALILLMGSVVIKEARDKAEKAELDFLGVLLSAGGLLVFVYGIIESSTYGWWKATQAFKFFGHSVPGGLSPTPWGVVIGAGLIALFAWWQLNAEEHGHTPLVSMHLFQNKQFTSGASVMSFMSFGMVGLIFTVPVFLQSTRNLDALHTGFALLPMSLAMLIMAPFSAWVSHKVAPKRLIQTGLVIAIVASAVLSLSIHANAGPWNLAPGLFIFGAGLGCVMAQVSNFTLSAVSADQAGEASGVNNTLRQVGSSFGSAVIGAVLLTTLSTSLASGIHKSTVIPDVSKDSLATNLAAHASSVELSGTNQKSDGNTPPAIVTELKRISNEASANGAQKAIDVTGIFVAIAFGMSFLLPDVADLDRSAKPAASH